MTLKSVTNEMVRQAVSEGCSVDAVLVKSKGQWVTIQPYDEIKWMGGQVVVEKQSIPVRLPNGPNVGG